jgi:uncharacterized protein YbjT (DUF2867 family)
MMILVTGSTGNVGGAVVKELSRLGVEIHAAGRTSQAPEGLTCAAWRQLDFERGVGLELGDRYDALFLVRPPQLADPAPFEALLRGTSTRTRVVFLSVQGAGGRPWLPHAKIEKAILRGGFPHAHFLRPGYFMENFTTTLAPEIQRAGRIFLPSGSLGFNWTAIEDIAAVAAKLLTEGGPGAVELTGPEALGFQQAIEIVNEAAGVRWRYQSPSALGYVLHARRVQERWIYVLVQLMLHWWPRFTGQDPLTREFQALMGREPIGLRDWAVRNREPLERITRPEAAPGPGSHPS